MIEPGNPANPFEWLLRLLFAIFVSLEGGSFTSQPEPPAVEPAYGGFYHEIESVEIRALESSPWRISLHIAGHRYEGCPGPVRVIQQREGNTIYVEIYQEVPPNVRCAPVYTAFEDDILLEGSFTDGSYLIDINGYIVDMRLGAITESG